MDEETRFKRFLADTRDRAVVLAAQEHITLEARECLKDFIEISRQTENLLRNRHESSADHRVLSKRYEALKGEAKELQTRMNKVKEVFAGEVTQIIKGFSNEASLIAERGSQTGDGSLEASAMRLRASVKKLVEVFMKI